MPLLFRKWWRPVGAFMALAVAVPVGLLLLAGLWSSARSSAESAFQPAIPIAGAATTREDCLHDKLRQQQRANAQEIWRATSDCELTFQSSEGHEQRRREWEQRQAGRKAEAAAAAAATAVPAPNTSTGTSTGQRVWR